MMDRDDPLTDFPDAQLDMSEYAARLQEDNAAGLCFICEIVKGERSSTRPIIYRDDLCIAFPPLYQRLVGYTLLAPIEHRTGVVSDFSEEEYVEIQRRIHRLGRAIMKVVEIDRLYVFSFGSNQGVAHVHWHLAPLPPGTSFESQQFAAVDTSTYYDFTEAQTAELAARIARAIEP